MARTIFDDLNADDPKKGPHIKLWASSHDLDSFWARHPDVEHIEYTDHFDQYEDVNQFGFFVSIWLTEEGWRRHIEPTLPLTDLSEPAKL